MTVLESVPTIWNDLLDGQFFRIVAHLLDPHLTEAATCLLSANDTD